MLKIKIAEPTLEEVTQAIDKLEQVKQWLILNDKTKELKRKEQ